MASGNGPRVCAAWGVALLAAAGDSVMDGGEDASTGDDDVANGRRSRRCKRVTRREQHGVGEWRMECAWGCERAETLSRRTCGELLLCNCRRMNRRFNLCGLRWRRSLRSVRWAWGVSFRARIAANTVPKAIPRAHTHTHTLMHIVNLMQQHAAYQARLTRYAYLCEVLCHQSSRWGKTSPLVALQVHNIPCGTATNTRCTVHVHGHR